MRYTFVSYRAVFMHVSMLWFALVLEWMKFYDVKAFLILTQRCHKFYKMIYLWFFVIYSILFDIYVLIRNIFANIKSLLLDNYTFVCQMMSQKTFIVGPILDIIWYFAFLINILVTLQKEIFFTKNKTNQKIHFYSKVLWYVEMALNNY